MQRARTTYPFGSKAEGYESDRRDYTNHEVVGVDNDDPSSRYQAVIDMKARTYLPGLGIFAQVDPLANRMPSYSPYAYAFNDPVNFTDPTGLSPYGIESTHTDADGNVVDVINDGDNGVYRHDDISSSTSASDQLAILRAKRALGGTSGGARQMGTTANWDEFANPEDGSAMIDTRIDFGSSWNPTISSLAEEARGMDLRTIAANSGPGGNFDLKANPDHADKGRLLDGQYASTRSAGNYLAGYNAQGGTMFGVGISFDTFQKLAGRLHYQRGNVTVGEKLRTVMWGEHVGTAPTYGEIPYQYRMSRAGWNAATAAAR